jgi:hypothetical protein
MMELWGKKMGSVKLDKWFIDKIPNGGEDSQKIDSDDLR